MTAHINTVAFQGIDTLDIDVQVHLSGGQPRFTIVGLPDKAVSEAEERVRAAFSALGLALPPKRITVNLSPADVRKEGGHYDLPIALGLLVALEILPAEDMVNYTVMGELALDGAVAQVSGVLPAAIAANASSRGLICPADNGGEAAWAGETLEIVAAPDLLALINHFKGTQMLSRPQAERAEETASPPDLRDVKGQETAKRALEVAAAGGHNLLMCGPPGSGKSMLAARMPGILPPMSASEALEVSMIRSVSGLPGGGRLSGTRPFRDPHHSASLPALVGGGVKAKPGEISLAHNGVLFLDELPEFSRPALEALRQPLETGKAVVARANAHVSWPARFQLVAAMNPCRCGYLGEADRACNRAPHCGEDYQSRLSGPLLDRFDLYVEVAAVQAADLALPPPAEDSARVAERIHRARRRQAERLQKLGAPEGIRVNAQADGRLLEALAAPEDKAQRLLERSAETLKLSARGYHRVLRVARTLADMEGKDIVESHHVLEAVAYRRAPAVR